MPRDPSGHDVSVGWQLLRSETHGQTEIVTRHYLLCPNCTITFQPKQASLSLNRPTTRHLPPTTPQNPETPR